MGFAGHGGDVACKGSAFREGRPVQTERIAAWVEREAVQRPPKAFARGLEEGFAADPTTQEGAIPIVGRGDPTDLGGREPAAGDEHGLGQRAHGFDVHAYRGVLAHGEQGQRIRMRQVEVQRTVRKPGFAVRTGAEPERFGRGIQIAGQHGAHPAVGLPVPFRQLRGVEAGSGRAFLLGEKIPETGMYRAG